MSEKEEKNKPIGTNPKGGALWENKDKNGETYWVADIVGHNKITFFKQKKKE